MKKTLLLNIQETEKEQMILYPYTWVAKSLHLTRLVHWTWCLGKTIASKHIDDNNNNPLMWNYFCDTFYIRVMLKLNMTWKDRRLEYLNLREDIYQNILPDDEKENVWIPTIGIRKRSTLIMLFISLRFYDACIIFRIFIIPL